MIASMAAWVPICCRAAPATTSSSWHWACTVAGQYDIIEGGIGSDELIITLNSAQLGTAAVMTELAHLKTFLAAHGTDPTAHFISDVLHVDLSGVEATRLRVDGVVKVLAMSCRRMATASSS